MRNKDKILVYIFLVILFVIISGLLYQSNKTNSTNTKNIEKFEFNSSIQSAQNVQLTNVPIDLTIQQPKPINSRPCTVYRVDDPDTTVDQHLRDLCDNGFFDRSLNDINNRLQYLNSNPANALTSAEQTELYDINNYYQKYKDIPYKACKADLFNWYEPTQISNGDKNIVKNDKDTVNRDPTSWAYCYKPVSTTSQNNADINNNARTLADNVANSGKGINAVPLSISSDLTSYVSPFNDNNIYSRVVFNTFTVDDFINNPVNPNAQVINGNICAPDNLPGNISDITNRMRANYLVFQLQDTANTVAFFNPANFNKTTHRFEIISDPAYLKNIYAQLFVDVTNIAPQNDQNIICSPNTFGSAFVHMLRNDICNDPAMKGKIFEKSGRVIDIKNQTTFPFSLATNLGVPSTTLGQTVNNMTISQLQQQIINLNADIVAKQADIQQQRNNIASAESIIRDLEISLAGAIIAAIFNPTALYVIAGNIALQQQYISGYQSQIASDSQAIINDLNTIINYLNTIQTLEGQFLSMIDNYVNEKNPAFLIGNTFTNFDFTKESNDANIYVYIGQDLVTTNGIYDNMKIYCYSQNCTASQAVAMPIPCQLNTANNLLTSMTGINQTALSAAENAKTKAEWKSIGCFKDSSTCRTIPHKLNTIDGSLNSSTDPLYDCIKLANNANAGYDTIGLQDGNCYAGKAPIYNLYGNSSDNQCSTGNFGSPLTNKVYTKSGKIPDLPQDVPGYIKTINTDCGKYANEHFANPNKNDSNNSKNDSNTGVIEKFDLAGNIRNATSTCSSTFSCYNVNANISTGNAVALTGTQTVTSGGVSANYQNLNPITLQVVLYVDCGYSGKSKGFPIGNYPWLPYAGFPNDALSSISVPEGLTVDLYWDGNFQGEKWTINGPYNQDCFLNIPSRNTRGLSWNDQVSSMKVYSANYSPRQYKNIPNVDYPGGSITYYTGQFSDCPLVCDNTPGCIGYIPRKDNGHDCWLKGTYTDNLRNTLHTNFRDINFIENDPNAPQVIVYEDCWYGGRSKNFGIGEYPWIEDAGFPNDMVSSIVVPAGLSVDLYWDWHFEGEKLTIDGPSNIECLTNKISVNQPWLSWNDQISSLKVRYT